MHKFTLVNCDTDSIMVCNPDGSPINPDEQARLLLELNSLFPDTIRWEDDGYFSSVVVLKAKNYIMRDEAGKVKSKGSALKASQKEPALKEFISKVTTMLLDHDLGGVVPLYHTYVKEILAIQDISRWATKRTITQSVLNPQRLNEQKVLDAVEGLGVGQGDKVYLYYNDAGDLREVRKWASDHSVTKLLKRLYDTVAIFENVLDIEQFTNYSLKTMALRLPRLDEIIEGQARGGKVVKVKTKLSNHDFIIEYPNAR